MNPLEQIKQNLFNNVASFVNELELSFDYIDAELISKINKYIEDIKNKPERFGKFAKFTRNHLGLFEKQICFILFGKQKVRTEQYEFVNSILLFGDDKDNCLLNLSLFDKENKNTKKGFLKYVYNIYMSCLFLSSTKENLTEELNLYLEKVQKEIEEASQANAAAVVPTNKQKQKKRETVPSMASMMTGMMGGGGGMPAGLENIMSNLMGNKDILNIATEISEQMKSEKINPMSMLSGLMSGKMDPRLTNLVSKVQENVESKITSGEINKEQFEEQAKNIIQTVNSSDIDMGVPGMLSHLMKDIKGMNGSGENNVEINDEELEKFIKELEQSNVKEKKK
jgi:cob(I)alamin adenosyltransferase